LEIWYKLNWICLNCEIWKNF